jgi:hypothetical protein
LPTFQVQHSRLKGPCNTRPRTARSLRLAPAAPLPPSQLVLHTGTLASQWPTPSGGYSRAGALLSPPLRQLPATGAPGAQPWLPHEAGMASRGCSHPAATLQPPCCHPAANCSHPAATLQPPCSHPAANCSQPAATHATNLQRVLGEEDLQLQLGHELAVLKDRLQAAQQLHLALLCCCICRCRGAAVEKLQRVPARHGKLLGAVCQVPHADLELAHLACRGSVRVALKLR